MNTNYKITGGVPFGCGLMATDIRHELIKEYPGSEKKGTIYTLVVSDLDFEPTHYRTDTGIAGVGSFWLREIVEKNPEHFIKLYTK